MKKESASQFYPIRYALVLAGVFAVIGLLGWRAVFLNVSDQAFLQGQGDARQQRVVKLNAHRGMILDRNAEPLAISTPVESVWVDPKEFVLFKSRWGELEKTLGLRRGSILGTLSEQDRMQRRFVYLARNVQFKVADEVRKIRAGKQGIKGVYFERAYKRYYPSGEVAAHVVGFTGIDDDGLEGVERSLDHILAGVEGKKRIVQNLQRDEVELIEQIEAAKPGLNVALTIDKRLQYLLYRELKASVKRHNARSASAVVLDAQNGEILAMASQPAFNPNNTSERTNERVRNRSIADIFEPGSTMKPFTVAAALESGQYQADSVVQTSPGWMKLGRYTIRDKRDNGPLSLAEIIQKSSNIGAGRIALSLDSEEIWSLYDGVGFGVSTGVEFDGERSGRLNAHWAWSQIEKATVSYGYGLSVTPLQLARAYCLFSTGGYLPEINIRLNPEDNTASTNVKLISQKSALAVTRMLEQVVANGTGKKAAIPGFRVAGKTGTVHKLTDHGYDKGRYIGVFAGFAPVSAPRFVMVVMVDDPVSGQFYGGDVAAPVFSKVVGGALRLYDVKPDKVETQHVNSGSKGGAA